MAFSKRSLLTRAPKRVRSCQPARATCREARAWKQEEEHCDLAEVTEYVSGDQSLQVLASNGHGMRKSTTNGSKRQYLRARSSVN